MSGVVCCGVVVSSIIVGRAVSSVMDVEGSDNVCWLVWLLIVIKFDVTEEVEVNGSFVDAV